MTQRKIEDRLSEHANVFTEIGQRNMAAPYVEIIAKGEKDLKIAADLREARDTIVRLQASLANSQPSGYEIVMERQRKQEEKAEIGRLRAQVIDGCELATKLGLEIERLRAAIREMIIRPGSDFARADSLEWLESILRVGQRALGADEQLAGK